MIPFAANVGVPATPRLEPSRQDSRTCSLSALEAAELWPMRGRNADDGTPIDFAIDAKMVLKTSIWDMFSVAAV